LYFEEDCGGQDQLRADEQRSRQSRELWVIANGNAETGAMQRSPRVCIAAGGKKTWNHLSRSRVQHGASLSSRDLLAQTVKPHSKHHSAGRIFASFPPAQASGAGRTLSRSVLCSDIFSTGLMDANHSRHSRGRPVRRVFARPDLPIRRR
jgi:hypothetical protein